jgi:hypothetical protein
MQSKISPTGRTESNLFFIAAAVKFVSFLHPSDADSARGWLVEFGPDAMNYAACALTCGENLYAHGTQSGGDFGYLLSDEFLCTFAYPPRICLPERRRKRQIILLGIRLHFLCCAQSGFIQLTSWKRARTYSQQNKTDRIGFSCAPRHSKEDGRRQTKSFYLIGKLGVFYLFD